MNKTFINLIVCMIIVSSTAFAATESFSGKGEYIMEDTQIPKEAQEIAYKEAMRSIAQQAGVSIKGYSQSADNELTTDELEMMAITIAKVKEKNFRKEICADGKIKMIASVAAELDTEQAGKMLMELVEARKASKGYEQTLEEYTKKQAQYSDLKEQYSIVLNQNAKQMIRDGIKLEREGKNDEAMKHYQEAISANGKLAAAYSHRGHIYRKQGKNDLASKDYDKAASLDAEDAGWHYGKAVLLEKQGANTQAVEEYRTFVKMADIMEYDEEIADALEHIVTLDSLSVD